jgi:hypothetical protein
MTYGFAYDLGPPKTDPEYTSWRKDGGVRKVSMFSVDVVEFCGRNPSRWVRELPPGVKLGPPKEG